MATSATTFNRFAELPTELQLHIFRLAASISGPLPPKSRIFDFSNVTLNMNTGLVRVSDGPPNRLLRYISNHYIKKTALNTARIGQTRSKQGLSRTKITCHARIQLLTTNTLARLVALETWRREIATTPVLRYADNLSKTQILGVLDDLIHEMKSR